MKKQIVLGVFMFLINLIAISQNELFLKKTFIHDNDTLQYRVLFPQHYDNSKSYPLVIFLHGSGERGNDNEKQLTHGASLFTDSLNRINFPAIVIFPQCPTNQSWVNLKRSEDNTITFIDGKKPTKPLELVMHLLKYYKITEAVDNKRIYISGLSLGGMGTYDLICRHPRTFAAAIPICGAVTLKKLKKARKMAIRIYHGGSDNVVSPEYSRDAYIELKANGSQNVEFFEFPGVGHNSWDNAFSQPDFLGWMFSKKK